MRRLLFYSLKFLALISRILSSQLYMKLISAAHKSQKVHFTGQAEYIDYNSHLDASGGLTIRGGVVISTKVIILTHDWSCLIGLQANNKTASSPSKYAFGTVDIGEHSFIGAGAIILPNTKIGKYCIIGAGAVVKGIVEDYAIIAGNPARKINDTREWGKKFIDNN